MPKWLRNLWDALTSVWGAYGAYLTLIGVVARVAPDAAANTPPEIWYLGGLTFVSYAFARPRRKDRREMRETRRLVATLNERYQPRVRVALWPKVGVSFEDLGIAEKREAFYVALVNPGRRIVRKARVLIEDRYGWGADRVIFEDDVPPRHEPILVPLLIEHSYLTVQPGRWIYTSDFEVGARGQLPRLARRSQDIYVRVEADELANHLVVKVETHGNHASSTFRDLSNEIIAERPNNA